MLTSVLKDVRRKKYLHLVTGGARYVQLEIHDKGEMSAKILLDFEDLKMALYTIQETHRERSTNAA